MIYVDDSGHPQTGLAVYGWIEFRPDQWRSVLRSWLDTRKALWREFGVPVTRELHTTEYVNGRGRISKNFPQRHIHDGHEYWKDFDREVAHDCLETLRCTEGLIVGSVYRRGKPNELARTKKELYADLVARFESELAASDSLGLIFMDGDGSDSSYRSTHRSLALAQRRVIEGAIHLDSSGSQHGPWSSRRSNRSTCAAESLEAATRIPAYISFGSRSLWRISARGRTPSQGPTR